MGGTGISVGPITQFGSVFVNGVEFSTTGTLINKNGSPSDQSNLRIGMVVDVQGTFEANGTTGSATQIDFNDNLEGPIQSINTVDQSLIVMGQTVNVDAGTRYEVVTKFSDLQLGYVIEVSGLPQGDGTILATYIELKSTSCSLGEEFEVKGTISGLDTTARTFQIGDLVINYNTATFENLPSGGLSDGIFVEVQTTDCFNGGILIATKVEGLSAGVSGTKGTRVEMEGFVTRFISTIDFDVNGQPVSTTGATVYESGTSNDLALNARVEVEGKLDANGVLIANKISFDD
jgi:hypothetical protein